MTLVSLTPDRSPEYYVDSAEPVQSEAVDYVCPRGHEFAVRLNADRPTTPPLWRCRRHGQDAVLRRTADGPSPRAPKPLKNHWDRLCERRSLAELEQLLDSRLNELRATGEQ
ncbi:RNA polymerase-binding protein RbpA [Allokutzneria sp. A3M-2-11 16]|nr:RNA polymerase-binding protein RbpA [Allokutzneria sp. A3M-2-11 16]